MKNTLEKRTTELEGLRAQNTEQLIKNKATHEKLAAEIQAGNMRDVAIANRIDEIASLIKQLPDHDIPKKAGKP